MSTDETKLDGQSLQLFLQNSEYDVPKEFYEQFSDLPASDLDIFSRFWKTGTIQRKLDFFEGLELTAASETLVSYEALGMMLIHDPAPAIRKAAIELLWESEDYRFADELFQIAKDDADISVQIAAVRALGTYVYLGELDKFSDHKKEAIENYLLEVIHSDEIGYKRQKALESLGYSCLDEIPDLIQKAVDSHDQDWLLSALIAMGRTVDEQWEPYVLENLDHQDTEIQLEAMRTAGELEIGAAVEFLVAFIEDSDEISDEYFTTIVWALSQIGGDTTIELINTLLENAQSEEDIEFLENALDNLEIKHSNDSLDFFSFDPANDHFHAEGLDDEDAYVDDIE
ncbi:MAG: HEAT repeat domain-containing protein [Anaerolineaceae bacterium]|nr:HEAT repeat domain-containing protein [Anaerolineaceae bacterium]